MTPEMRAEIDRRVAEAPPIPLEAREVLRRLLADAPIRRRTA